MNSLDNKVFERMKVVEPDPDAPKDWPMKLRKCLQAAKEVMEFDYGQLDDYLDVWLRLNYELSRKAVSKVKPKEYFITYTVPAMEEHLDPNRVLWRAAQMCRKYAVACQWCLEVTKQGYPHVHMLVTPGTTYPYLSMKKKQIASLNNDYCKGAWMQKPRSRQAVLDYISKLETKPTDGYLKKWGLDGYKGDLDTLLHRNREPEATVTP